MALPLKALPKETLEIEGQKVEIRSLSRSEALKLTTAFADNPDGAELFILTCGAGVPEAEAKAWRDETDPITAGKVIDAIIYLTGLGDSDEVKKDSNGH